MMRPIGEWPVMGRVALVSCAVGLFSSIATARVDLIALMLVAIFVLVGFNGWWAT